jgi:hydrogenase expression/formation protein HypC
MCLAVPARLLSISGNDALADLHGNQVPVSTILVPYATAGDRVLIHAGFAIQQLEAHDAEQTFAVIEDLDAAARAAGDADADPAANGDESG